jgi:8-oxo-dGTP pyrophosphatase MutT (NUDIX family)
VALREFSAGGVVVRRMAGRWWVAAVRPRRDLGQKQVWALPKGLIDPGERGHETAVREVFEETGLHARLDRKLGDVRYVYSRRGGERVFKVVSFFLLRAGRGRLGELPPGMDLEVTEARWFPLADAVRVLAYQGEREMAERALTILAEDTRL